MKVKVIRFVWASGVRYGETYTVTGEHYATNGELDGYRIIGYDGRLHLVLLREVEIVDENSERYA